MNYSKEQLFIKLREYNIKKEIIETMLKIPRENFIDEIDKDFAYNNSPLRIDCMQTISQPYIVARMTELVIHSKNMDKILEIGTGSGYQAAILSLLVNKIYTLERFKKLSLKAKKRLKTYSNVFCYHADGFHGLEKNAPFDGIIITAAINKVPDSLILQMSNNSVIVYPEKNYPNETLTTIYKHNDSFSKTYHEQVRFVPMLPGLA
ncbi:MAG: protein-L-isoaspartate(D-aspartate) O-methyltransferase [Legionellales bacterium]|nr:protein-L-isoaspartate(D-aspartate) O-methyltransferase [Legionellales bacterium]